MAGLQTLVDTLKKILGAKDAATRSKLTIQFTKEVLSAKKTEAELRAEIIELKQQVANFENWDVEKQHYELVKLDPDVLIYRLKPEIENGDTPHELCADCYNRNQKSLLHVTDSGYGFTYWKCSNCGFDEKSGEYTAQEEDEYTEYAPFSRV